MEHPDKASEQVASAESHEPSSTAYERARNVPGVVAGEGLFSVPLGEMFGLWRFNRRKRSEHEAEKRLAGM